MPCRDFRSNCSHFPIRIANTLTAFSLATRWPNAVALSCCLSGGGSSLGFSSLCSRKGLVRSASGIFPHCYLFGVRRADNRPLLLSYSGFLALNDGKLKTRSYIFIATTKSSNSLTGIMYSKYWNKRLAFRLTFADIITWPWRPWAEVNAGSYGNLRFLSRLGDIRMLIALQSISSLTHCMLPVMYGTRTWWMICVESGLYVPDGYWLDIGAQPSKITIDFKTIRCSCISSRVENTAWFLRFSNPNSVSSSLSLQIRYRER